MAKANDRTYSHYTREALALLAALVREARLEKKMSAQELADRAGVSRGLIQRIEKADPRCGIGVTFEVASILGLTLFESDERAMVEKKMITLNKIALMPKSIRKSKREVDDDF